MPPYFLKKSILTNRLKMRFFKMEKCNFLKILQCPDFENLWGDSWHLFQPKKLDESDGGFCFLRIIFLSHVNLSLQWTEQIIFHECVVHIVCVLLTGVWAEFSMTNWHWRKTKYVKEPLSTQPVIFWTRMFNEYPKEEFSMTVDHLSSQASQSSFTTCGNHNEASNSFRVVGLLAVILH